MAHVIVGLTHQVCGECAEAEQTFAKARVSADQGQSTWVQNVEMAGSGGVLIQTRETFRCRCSL